MQPILCKPKPNSFHHNPLYCVFPHPTKSARFSIIKVHCISDKVVLSFVSTCCQYQPVSLKVKTTSSIMQQVNLLPHADPANCVPSQAHKNAVFHPNLVLPACSLHILPVTVWNSPRCSSVVLLPKDERWYVSWSL